MKVMGLEGYDSTRGEGEGLFALERGVHDPASDPLDEEAIGLILLGNALSGGMLFAQMGCCYTGWTGRDSNWEVVSDGLDRVFSTPRGYLGMERQAIINIQKLFAIPFLKAGAGVRELCRRGGRAIPAMRGLRERIERGDRVIGATRFDGTELVVDCGLIEFVEENPDTMISLSTGSTVTVQESAQEIVERVAAFKKRSHIPFIKVS